MAEERGLARRRAGGRPVRRAAMGLAVAAIAVLAAACAPGVKMADPAVGPLTYTTNGFEGTLHYTVAWWPTDAGTCAVALDGGAAVPDPTCGTATVSALAPATTHTA